MLLVLVPSLPTQALSSEQKSIYNSGVYFFDYSATGVCTTDDAGGTVSSTLPGNIPEPYKSLFTKAATAFKTNPQFIAALFLSEHSNNWVPADSNWGTSSVGAKGPFQFMPITWDGYKTDGNNDGIKDVQNLADSAFSAANWAGQNGVKNSTKIGSLDKPFAGGTMMYKAGAYNAGFGTISSATDPDMSFEQALNKPPPKLYPETTNYMKNFYYLLTSGFTKGDSSYGNPGGKGGGTDTDSANLGNGGCSGGVVAGSVVQTALSLAWDTTGHGKDQADAKPTYQKAMPQYNGATSDDPYSDCGVFVATVMIGSGADTNYPKRGTPSQKQYIEAHPEKYTVVTASSTSELQPGDIFVSSNHTYFYVGKQPGGYNAVGASLHGHVPQPTIVTFTDINGEAFLIARLK